MSLESMLLPTEEIRFRAARPLKYGQSQFQAYVTNKRLVLYAKRGLFGRDDFIAFNLKDVSSSKYHEEGLLMKTGYFTIAIGNTSAKVYGSPVDVKQVYMAAQNPQI
jgi:hypothetical protein